MFWLVMVWLLTFWLLTVHSALRLSILSKRVSTFYIVSKVSLSVLVEVYENAADQGGQQPSNPGDALAAMNNANPVSQGTAEVAAECLRKAVRFSYCVVVVRSTVFQDSGASTWRYSCSRWLS